MYANSFAFAVYLYLKSNCNLDEFWRKIMNF